MSGTVNISRDIWTDPDFPQEPMSQREAFIWMVAEASWKPRKRRIGDHVVDLERGQLGASVRFLAAAWMWSPAKVQRFLERLRKMESITTKTDTGVTVITLCNYDEYQAGAKATDTPPIQDRYTSDTNEKKEEIRGEEIPSDEGISEHRSRPAKTKDAEQMALLRAVASEASAASFLDYRRRNKKAGALSVTGAKRLAASLRQIFDSGGSPDDALAMAEERGWASVAPEWYFKEVRKNGSDRAPSPPQFAERGSPHDGMLSGFQRAAAGRS